MAVAALTSDDLDNIKIALAARQRRPDIHVVVRVFNDVLAERLRALFGIHTAYSTSRLAAPTLAAAALLPGAECAFFAGENLYTRDEYVVGKDDEFAGKTGEELRAHHNMLVIEREREWGVAPAATAGSAHPGWGSYRRGRAAQDAGGAARSALKRRCAYTRRSSRDERPTTMATSRIAPDARNAASTP